MTSLELSFSLVVCVIRDMGSLWNEFLSAEKLVQLKQNPSEMCLRSVDSEIQR